MKIKSFSIKNFRSITQTNDLTLFDYTVLIGPNNAGKSNILNALILAHRFIGIGPTPHFRHHRTRFLTLRSIPDNSYDLHFNRHMDIPYDLQNDNTASTSFVLVYSLSSDEKKEFRKIHKNLKGDLKISIFLNVDYDKLEIVDTNDSKKINKNIDKIKMFISNRIQIKYIDTIRNSDKSIEIINEMIAEKLSDLQDQKQYKTILSRTEKMYKNISKELSEKITESVSEFLPNITNISLDTQFKQRIMKGITDVYVDDGANTPLETKGNGIQSLVVISLIHYFTYQPKKKNIILIIDEPESHLHSDAIHTLYSVLRRIADKNQVMISTHSPLLINRSNISENIIVDKSQSVSAKNKDMIRKIMGIKIADNLQSANMVLLVEGKNDEKLLSKILMQKSSKIKKAIEDGTIRLCPLHGVHNLTHIVQFWMSSLCDVYVFLDNDPASIQACKHAMQYTHLTEKFITFAIAKGLKESELEDLFDISYYNDEILYMFNINLKDNSVFKKQKFKWSDRVKRVFMDNSKPYTSDTEKQLKNLVTDTLIKQKNDTLYKHQSKSITDLISALENYVA